MLGRERDLETVRSALADAKRNRAPAIVRISGETGMGKTLFLSELARGLNSHGWFVLQAACHQIQQHTPRLLANRVVASAIEHLGPNSSRYTGGLEEALAGFDAAIARAIGTEAAAKPIDPQSYATTFLRLFEGIAVDYDVAILCDDAQWIDPESAKTIRTLLEKISSSSVSLVLTANEWDAENPTWTASIDVRLNEFDLESSLRFIAEEMPTLNREVAEVVAQHAGGNPFELAALCEELRASGTSDIERSLRSRTAKQLSTLEPEVREFIQICALLGDPIEHRILSEMYGDRSTLERLISMAEPFVVNSENELRFKHAMLAQSVVATIAVPIPLRRRIIDTLQSPNLQELTDYERIAEHAAACGDLQLQRRALVGLARDAYGREAWASAVSASERALQIRGTGPLDPSFLLVYVQALRVFDREPEAVAFLLPELSRYDLREAEGFGAVIGILIAMLVELARFDEALAIFRRFDPLIRLPSERAPLVAMMMWGAAFAVDETLYRELSEAFEALGDGVSPRFVSTVHAIRAGFASLNGDAGEARRAVAAAFANVDLRDPRHPHLLNFTKMLFDFRDDGCGVLAVRLNELKEFFVRDAVDFWFYGRLCEASLAFFSADWETAGDIVAATYGKTMPPSRAAKILGIAAAMEAIGGKKNPFAAETEALCITCWQERDWHSAMHVLPWWLVDHSNPELEKFAEQLALASASRAMVFFAVSYVPLGFALSAAVRSKKDILERFAATETPPDRSSWGSAQWRLARGVALQSLRRDEAKSVLRSAREAFRALSSPLFSALASHYAGESTPEEAALLLQIGVSGKTKPSPPKRHDLTAREWDVARLVRQGATNRQIAEKLFVSERTVEVHLGNIFGKLTLSSRVQLVRWLYENEGTS